MEEVILIVVNLCNRPQMVVIKLQVEQILSGMEVISG